MVKRYSSRVDNISEAFLKENLRNASSYDRIAGYFSSSILEVIKEEIFNVKDKIRIVCNSDIQINDYKIANQAMRKEWCDSSPEENSFLNTEQFKTLYELLKSKKLEVRILPNAAFGLIHGKAGVITKVDGSQISFIGSVNETYSAWKKNYELLWEDDEKETVDWTQKEFDSLWNSEHAIPLSEFIIEDVGRIAQREIIKKLEEWREKPSPDSIVIEDPIYRNENGLWEHQKYFVDLAFKYHQSPKGARFLLADQVGLGKTIQLALTAKLMALYGDKPILIIVPKTLLFQWQDEMKTLLDFPSAVWDGSMWIDESGNRHSKNILKCPRQVGIISQGLITSNSAKAKELLEYEYECVIVDETHRARRNRSEKGVLPKANNLMEYLVQISKKTKSMLLATATPVQLDVIEAWDLLYILSGNNNHVLGDKDSKWMKNPWQSMELITGEKYLNNQEYEYWQWFINPFPMKYEGRLFEKIRMKLEMNERDHRLKSELFKNIPRKVETDMEELMQNDYFLQSNPFLLHIVRRTRKFLETTIDPQTKEPYLKEIKISLVDNETIDMNTNFYFKNAYEAAIDFSKELQKRIKTSAFIKTMILKRLGSTVEAGKNTAEKILENWDDLIEESDFDELEVDEALLKEISNEKKKVKGLLPNERKALEICVRNLALCTSDPKYSKIKDLLLDKKWLERGCIIFSQFYDSIKWVANELTRDLKEEPIAIYAGGDKTGYYLNGIFHKRSREEIKDLVKNKKIRLLLGTDAASEGLNLQTLGTLINLDLPWNPTRLEQRKGRIQRIGQTHDEVYIYNMRYKDSIEDRVHELLSNRLENIHSLFGQIPDVLEDVWILVAQGEEGKAEEKLNEVAKKNPFMERYESEKHISHINWESCWRVLDKEVKRNHLLKGWKK